MRERKGSGFGRRSVASESKQAIKKYFLLYEGSDTEVLYFDAIEDMRKEIELNSLIELVPIIRCFSEEGWSNPRKILDRVIQDLKERDTGTISFKTLFDKIIDYFHEKQKVYFHYPTRLELKTQPLCLIVLFLIHIDTNPLFFLYEDAISHKHNQNHFSLYPELSICLH